jgi:Flp pilus assembly protein TadG
MTARRLFWLCERGAIAAEFALVLPVFVLLTIGTIGVGTMMSMIVSLHFAVEDAARCASVKTTVCTNAGTTQTYATGQYKGPTVTGLAFALTAAAAGNCGNKVVGTGTYTLRTGLGAISVPVSASACYPSSS